MTKAYELSKRIYQINQELAKVAKTKFDLDMKVNALNEELWRLQGMLEEETDEHEYRSV